MGKRRRSLSSRSELKEFFEIESELHKIQDEDILLERILFEARKMVRADAGSLYTRRDNKLQFTHTQNDTMQRSLPPGQKLIYRLFTVDIDKSTISGYTASTGESVNISDAYNLPENAPYSFNPSYDRKSGYRTESVLCVPLKTAANEILGVIQVINAMNDKKEVVPFTDEDALVVAHFASSATVALQRAQMTRAIILRMIRMAELRDPKETGPHVNRVAGYATELYERWAARRGLDESQIDRTRDLLRMAAMLHDVGKVAISDLILKKPARFTEDEYRVMKSHTFQGARLFSDRQSEFDEIAGLVAISHHENWDGSGYPGRVDTMTGEAINPDENAVGLVGEEIPLFGRIVAIADVYDALSCARVYKVAWSEEAVLAEIRKLSGIKFDPELVEVFFEVLPNIKSVASKYPDHQE